MTRRTIAIAGWLVTLLVSGTASANGFFLWEASPSSVGQGGATVADGSEPATLLFNSAGLTRLDGFQLQANLYTYIANNTWKDPNTGEKQDAETGVFPIPSLFASYKPIDWLSVGVGGYSTFGLSLGWPDRWKGSTISQKSSLRSYSVQPAVAVGPFSGFSLGAGLTVTRGSVKLERGLRLGNDYGTSTLGGVDTGYAPSVSVLFEAKEWFRFGAQYRHKTVMTLDPGKIDFDVPAAYGQQLRDQNLTASITLPAMTQFGLRMQPGKNIEFEFDGFLILWHTYDELAFKFEDPTINQTQKTNWHDAWEWRIGGQYTMDELALRAGFIWDSTPIPDETLDPLLPDNHRMIPSVGVGYDFGMVRADAAYQFVYLLPREVNEPVNKFPGKYNAIVHTIALGATMRL
ncbi:MAG TPA: outer membrane protein transport protein [Polyangiaceae bacterium]|nr:MAG: putative outer membrane protein precursor [Deltaproteobacteria bacterium ADurb.Bin207]HOT10428.1 outer membrane protein transport protein [Polyangiaceae bacterium]HPB97127.1 outer membrane protein transport protein [Polyangiaceae bacterium]HQB43892.1 outer membrane protein transport protein [Polyangiaceae bacterium]HQK19015.1 outer membrane protein transport protein [Polyangiaceae bacterium]